MRWQVLFDKNTKLGVISSHGYYQIFSTISTGEKIQIGEKIQDGLTDELGFVYNFMGDDLIDDPSDVSLDELKFRLSELCGRAIEERWEIIEQERAKFLVEQCGIEFTGRWSDLGIFGA